MRHRAPKSHRKQLIALALILSALLLLTVFAVKLADGTFNNEAHPTITASPNVRLHEPEPMITADSQAKVPAQPKPTVTTEAAPIIPKPPTYVSTPSLVAPDNIPPYLQAPNTQPVVPLPAPQQPTVAPIVPLPQPVLPPAVTKPVEGLTAPLKPITDPIIKPLKPIVRPLVPPLLDPITDPLLK